MHEINRRPPESMTVAERMDEVSALLARGYVPGLWEKLCSKSENRVSKSHLGLGYSVTRAFIRDPTNTVSVGVQMTTASSPYATPLSVLAQSPDCPIYRWPTSGPSGKACRQRYPDAQTDSFLNDASLTGRAMVKLNSAKLIVRYGSNKRRIQQIIDSKTKTRPGYTPDGRYGFHPRVSG